MLNAATQSISNISHPWGDMTSLNDLLYDIGDAQFVLLGEASHGTHDYYLWRARISQKLITEKGFSLIAVEGDWPDCYRLNRYIKHYPDSGEDAKTVLRLFNRWPTWMWANQEMVEFAEWLREYNARFDVSDRIGFFGLDVYSLWESIQAVISYLDEVDSQAAHQARHAYRCFEPYGEAGERYAYHTAMVPETCEDEVLKILTTLRTNALHSFNNDHELQFNAAQNANIVVNAEHYYRTMLRSDNTSWNIRDYHMTETVGNLLGHYGNDSKLIIWAHNTHVGDARYTDMPLSNMVNIGQLMRESYGVDQVKLVGFGSYAGSVIAGSYWDAPMQNLIVPPAIEGSWEYILHSAGPDDKLLLSNEMKNEEDLWRIRPNRAIGVVYDPKHERGNYVPTLLPKRYDSFIYINTTKAVRPLHTRIQENEDYPETFPWGV